MFMKMSGVPRCCAACWSWCTTSKSPLASAPATITEGVTATVNGGSASPTATVAKVSDRGISVQSPSGECRHLACREQRADPCQRRCAAPECEAQLIGSEEERMNRILHVRAKPAVHVLYGMTHAMPGARAPPLGREHLGSACELLAEQPQRPQVRRAQRLELDVTVRQAMLHGLETADRPSKLLPLAHIERGAAQSLLQHAELQRGIADLGALKGPAHHRIRRSTQQLVARRADVAQYHARLGFAAGDGLRLDLKAGDAGFDHEHLRPDGRVRGHQQGVRLGSVWHADFLTRQTPAVSSGAGSG